MGEPVVITYKMPIEKPKGSIVMKNWELWKK